MAFWLKFWGTRGSIACPTPRHVVYGGNTSCLEVGVGDARLVLDAGTGIRELGMSFVGENVVRATLLLTHTHWDHINGFPFFVPGYRPDFELRVMAGHLVDEGGVQKVLAGQMVAPMFPVPLSALRAKLSFEDFRAGDTFEVAAGVTVRTKPLRHPNGATGYRIEHRGRALCYVTDTEHVVGKPDEDVLALIDGADLVVYDSTYTDDEFPKHVGWGHSTWQEGIRLARLASVKRLCIFHHDPSHDDVFMRQLERDAAAAFPGAVVAREGMRIDLLGE